MFFASTESAASRVSTVTTDIAAMEHVVLPEDAATAWEGAVTQVDGKDALRGDTVTTEGAVMEYVALPQDAAAAREGAAA